MVSDSMEKNTLFFLRRVPVGGAEVMRPRISSGAHGAEEEVSRVTSAPTIFSGAFPSPARCGVSDQSSRCGDALVIQTLPNHFEEPPGRIRLGQKILAVLQLNIVHRGI